jgi:ESF2/ABP1 family protein
MSQSRNSFLAHASSDESDNDQGYDSEAAEVSKTSRAAAPERAHKRRKLSPSESGDDVSLDDVAEISGVGDNGEEAHEQLEVDGSTVTKPLSVLKSKRPRDEDTISKPKNPDKKKKKKESRPGVVYLSSVPPHLRPSALRNLLEQRGFSPITRLFLTPITSATSTNKKPISTSKARRSYSEGWLEFASHKTARLCASALNATPIGGKKGGYYRDDLWNMKYLRGMGWEELMEGVRGEKREEEARRDEERRQIQMEAKMYLEGVEEGKRVEGIREKRKKKGDQRAEEGVKRTWRQFEARKNEKEKVKDGVSDEAREVLGKIF